MTRLHKRIPLALALLVGPMFGDPSVLVTGKISFAADRNGRRLSCRRFRGRHGQDFR